MLIYFYQIIFLASHFVLSPHTFFVRQFTKYEFTHTHTHTHSIRSKDNTNSTTYCIASNSNPNIFTELLNSFLQYLLRHLFTASQTIPFHLITVHILHLTSMKQLLLIILLLFLLMMIELYHPPTMSFQLH